MKAHQFYENLGFRRHGVSLHVDLTPEGEALPPTEPLEVAS